MAINDNPIMDSRGCLKKVITNNKIQNKINITGTIG